MISQGVIDFAVIVGVCLIFGGAATLVGLIIWKATK